VPTERAALYLQDARSLQDGIKYAQYAERKGFEAVWQVESSLVHDAIVLTVAFAAPITDSKKGRVNMTTDSILAILKELKPVIAARYKAKEIGLFGSFARGEQTASSDIDVLVEFEEGADMFDLVGLADFLEEALQQKVDVVPKRALRAELRESVLREVVAV